MEVPDISVKSEYWVSPFNPVSDFRGVYDAKMSMPGATISGCFIVYQESGNRFIRVAGLMITMNSNPVYVP